MTPTLRRVPTPDTCTQVQHQWYQTCEHSDDVVVGDIFLQPCVFLVKHSEVVD